MHAVVQPAVPGSGTPELARELIDFCRSRIAHYKAPASVSFEDELPRTPSGKMLRRLLMDRYRASPTRLPGTPGTLSCPGFGSGLFRPQDRTGPCPRGRQRRDDGDHQGRDEEAAAERPDEPAREHRCRHHADLAGEGPPDHPSGRQAQRHADRDTDRRRSRGLPEHDGGELAPDEPQGLEQPAFPSPARHAHHHQVRERGYAARGHHDAAEQREVRGLAEAHQRGRNDGRGKAVRVLQGVPGKRSLARRAGP